MSGLVGTDGSATESGADTATGALAAVGMAMVPASIVSIEPAGDFRRVVLAAPGLAVVDPGGAAPVFKVFVARRGALRLPSFDAQRLAVPEWEADPDRPIVRAYTALVIDPAGGHITFDALDLDGSAWLQRAQVGDALAVIGFKHGVRPDATASALLAVGDRSARPALEAIAAATDLAVPVTVVCPSPPRQPAAARPSSTWLVAGTDRCGFPVVDVGALAPSPTTSVWIAGELDSVRRTRARMLGAGVPAERIAAHVYWRSGATRDQLDHDLYRRYREASGRGADITDPLVATEIELAAGSCAPDEPDVISGRASRR